MIQKKNKQTNIKPNVQIREEGFPFEMFLRFESVSFEGVFFVFIEMKSGEREREKGRGRGRTPFLSLHLSVSGLAWDVTL